MKAYNSNGLNFSLMFPDSWGVEEEGNVLSVFNANKGVGALQFSSYEVENIESVNLEEELREYVSGIHQKIDLENLGKYAFCRSEDDKGNEWRYWIFTRANTLVFASYNCLKEDVGKEDAEVNAIIKSAIDGK